MNDRVKITMLEDGIADVRMSRVDKMNALDPAQWSALVDAIDTLKATEGLRVVVLSGEGRAFCAGLDLASMQGDREPGTSSAGGSLADRTKGIANSAQYVAWGWRELPVPVIAAVHGVAFGAGSQIMAGADIRIVHPDTRIDHGNEMGAGPRCRRHAALAHAGGRRCAARNDLHQPRI
jgi:enoyl-CoA hydratase/carnithine racemase